MSEEAKYLTTKEAAGILGIATQTLTQSRNTNKLGGETAPPFLKRGRIVRYSQDVIHAWMSGGVWAVYSLEKSKIQPCSCEEYDRQIKAITERLGI